MDPLYVVIVVVAAIAAYFLFVDKRAARRKAPVRSESARRAKHPAGAARMSEAAPRGDDGGEEARIDVSPRATKRPRTEGTSGGPPPAGPGAADEEAERDGGEIGGAPCPCGSGVPFTRCHGADDSDATGAQPPAQPRPGTSDRSDERAAFPFSGKTVLFYEPSHGNQIEYYDRNGRCYLWYPGNRIILAGEWRVDGEDLCFRYAVKAHNPVTGKRTDAWEWERTPLRRWGSTVTDSAPGDVYGLATGFPFILPAHPKFRSVYEPKLRQRSG
ncbi:SEC-C metal-binding domain-containing protein [Sorangium sp. So ce861]|uniref:SEC-C metal-binding domain-containing protein n=1 Tax=Sorangium sp. So ce861 TaxID=3133323 RepID=UPI003F634D68